jgi:hypothetical protein
MKEQLQEKLHEKRTWIMIGIVTLVVLLSLLNPILTFLIVLTLSTLFIRSNRPFISVAESALPFSG